MHAPEHRLEAEGHEPLLHEASEGACDLGLVREVHRAVRLVPGAEDSETLEVFALLVDPPLGVLPAREPDRHVGHLALLRSELLVDVALDGEAVTVPARDVGRVETEERTAAHDEILEDLVHRGADVDLSVRVRRAVVEEKGRRALAGGADAAVEVPVHPARESRGLPLREVRPHGELRLREKEGGFPVASAHVSRGGYAVAPRAATRRVPSFRLRHA